MIFFSTLSRGQQVLTPLGSEQTTSLLVVLILEGKNLMDGVIKSEKYFSSKAMDMGKKKDRCFYGNRQKNPAFFLKFF